MVRVWGASMICPRPHCGGLLLVDDGEYACKACARRWTSARLRDAIRAASTALAAGEMTAPDETTSMQDRRAALLPDDEDDEMDRGQDEMIDTQDETDGADDETEDRPMTRLGWTEERRRKFQATMAEKRGKRAPKPEARSPKPKRVPPSSPRPNGGVFSGVHDDVPWSEWKRDWIERLDEAESKLSAKLDAVRELKAKVKTW